MLSASAHAFTKHTVACVPEKLSLAMLFLALRSVVSSRPVPLASCRHPVLQDTTTTTTPAGAIEDRWYTHATVVASRQMKESLQVMLRPQVHGEQQVCKSFSLAVPKRANARQTADLTHQKPSEYGWGGSMLKVIVRVVSLLMLALTCTECSTAGLHAP